MYWGTYRAGVMVGLSTRSSPHRMLHGLLFHKYPSAADAAEGGGGGRPQQFPDLHLRHQALNIDGLRFGYSLHDGCCVSEHTITDSKYHGVNISTQFTKLSTHTWNLAIHAQILENNANAGDPLAIVYYVGLEGDGHGDQVHITEDEEENIVVRGTYGDQPYEMSITGDGCTAQHKWAYRVDSKHVWNVEGELVSRYKQQWFTQQRVALTHQQQPHRKGHRKRRKQTEAFEMLPNEIEPDANVIMVQCVSKQLPLDVQVRFGHTKTKEEVKTVHTEAVKRFHERFDRVFPIDSKWRDLGLYALSNLLGGLAYFYGNSLQQREGHKVELVAPRSLFTASPTRAFFPRGFLWDEGFHQLLVSRWDSRITQDVVMHWLRLMDEHGWIAREQILGDEARSRVPREFQVQHSEHANPPTLFLAAQRLLLESYAGVTGESSNAVVVDTVGGQTSSTNGEATADTERNIASLKEMYALLDKHYQWFIRTQAGLVKGTYRWRGRTPGHTLSSGLDDYPRGVKEPSEEERHLDLYCWVYMMTEVLYGMRTKLFGEDEVAQELADRMSVMRRDLRRWHWNERISWYSDYINSGNYSDHIGYVSLFPLIVDGLLQSESDMNRVMDIIRNRDLLWSVCGVRSLAHNDTLFGTEENYWRGPVWMNVNYLILRGLHRVAHDQIGHWSETTRERAKKIHLKHRNNVLKCLNKSFRKTGTLHEQYHSIDGRGLRAHPFTGWSSLVLLIAADMY